MSRRRFVVIRTQREAFHQYEEAPDEVAFLRYPHRHIFHFTAKIQVSGADRELEFFMVQRKIQGVLPETDIYSSCESKAEFLLDYLLTEYGNHRSIIVEVSEDGENSAIVVDN
jgi:hypothetical protein